jgi:hypothetical protein
MGALRRLSPKFLGNFRNSPSLQHIQLSDSSVVAALRHAGDLRLTYWRGPFDRIAGGFHSSCSGSLRANIPEPSS